MKIWPKLLSPPVYIRKMNLVRKWIKSYFTNRHLSATLFGKLYFKHEHRTWLNTYWMGTPVTHRSLILKLPSKNWKFPVKMEF